MIFELAQDFHDAAAAMPTEHLARSMIDELRKAFLCEQYRLLGRTDLLFQQLYPRLVFSGNAECCALAEKQRARYGNFGRPWLRRGSPPYTPVTERVLYAGKEPILAFDLAGGLDPQLALGHGSQIVLVPYSRPEEPRAVASCTGRVTKLWFLSGTGQRVVALCRGGWCGVIDLSTGRELHSLPVGEPVVCVSPSRTGTRLLILTANNCQLWPVLGDSPLWTAPVSEARGTALAYDEDGDMVVVGYASGHVRVRDAHDGKTVTSVCLLSPVTGLRVVTPHDLVIAACEDGHAYGLSVKDDELRLIHSYRVHRGAIRCLDYHQAGKLLVTAGADQVVRLTKMSPEWEAPLTLLSGIPVSEVRFSAQQDQIVCSADNGTCRELVVPRSPKEAAHSASIVALAHDERRSAVYTCDAEGRATRWRVTDDASHAEPLALPGSHVTSICALQGRGPLIAGTSGSRVLLVDEGGAMVKQRTFYPKGAIKRIVATGVGKDVYVSSSSGTVARWKVGRGLFAARRLMTDYTVEALSLSPNGRFLACGGFSAFRLFDTCLGRFRKVSDVPEGVRHVVFSGSSRYMAFMTVDRCGVLDIETMEVLWEGSDARCGVPELRKGSIRVIAAPPAFDRLAVLGDHAAVVIAPLRSALLARLPSEMKASTHAAFSSDGGVLVAADTTGTVRVVSGKAWRTVGTWLSDSHVSALEVLSGQPIAFVGYANGDVAALHLECFGTDCGRT